ncbi:cell division protein FtsQ/DivIB [Sphingomonas sp. GCM10030256]|uniref:cell division protein FtsQ/DivIB n=1 Tax=Sphingomonas sp. GCM10030256 TaxID=3273427 RepID=UPI00361E2F66
MNAQAVRRGNGGGARGRSRKASSRSAGTATARALPVSARGAGRLARWAVGLFVLAMVAVALVALDIPAKIGRALGSATGEVGFGVGGYQIVGLDHMDRKLVDGVVTEELRRAGELSSGTGKPPQALVDLDRIRDELLQFGWVKDARVSRRLPDTLVVDIVERTPAAVWQNRQQLSLIDAEGVVLDRVPLDRMPDLPLVIGPAANRQALGLGQLMEAVPTLKPQLASASWVGGRRWDLNFQSGETVALPEGEDAASTALRRFAKMDRSTGLLGRGMVRFDLRKPGQMTVRLPRAAGETVVTDTETPS